MSDEKIPEENVVSIPFKNRWLALLLAWLFPGLGHLYQGRKAKGILFAVVLTPLIVAGIWMSSYREKPTEFSAAAGWANEANLADSNGGGKEGTLQIGRCAYFSWRQGDKRLYFIPQAANALVAVPAFLQANLVAKGKEPFFGGAMAPPRLGSQWNSQPSINEILLALHSWFDLGTIFVAVAGLLNILVLFDAFAGPAWGKSESGSESGSEEETDETSEGTELS